MIGLRDAAGLGEGVQPAVRRDLRLLPVAGATWVGTWVGTGGMAGAGGVVLAVVAVVAGLAGAAGALYRSARIVAVALVLGGGLSVGWAADHRLATGPVADLAAARAVVQAVVVTTADPVLQATRPGGKPQTSSESSRPDYLIARVRVREVSGRGGTWRLRAPLLVTVSGASLPTWRDAPVGSVLEVWGRLEPRDAGSEVAAVLRVRGPTATIAGPGTGLRLVEQVRAGLRLAVADRRPEPRALVPALVLGDTSANLPGLTEDFRTTGLTHLTAVSGANLTLLLAFILLAARWLGVRGWWLRVVSLLGVAVFVALCRTEPSVLRAAAMGLVALAALGAGSARAGLRHLCVAATVLLLADPLLARSVGFTLSVLASGGILWWARRWALALAGWAPRLVADAVAVTLAASLATLPVVAALSGAVSVVGLVANALAAPFVGPATVCGFAAAGLSLVSDRLATVAGFGAAWSAQPIIWVAHAGARLPGAALPWPADPSALVVLGLVALGSGLGMSWLLTRRWVCLSAALALFGVLAVVPGQPGWPPRDWVMVACDVGQGDGLVVRVADRQALVVDAGPDPPAMRRCLDQLDIASVPVMMLTHFHADHVDGLPGVLAEREVGQIWASPQPSPALEARQVGELAAAQGITVRSPAMGERGTIGEAAWEVLGPVPVVVAQPPESSGAENDSSLVVRVRVRGARLLLTGDVEPFAQQALLASGVDLTADVLKVPHHGSARQDEDFLRATRARVAVASAGAGNDYGHPAPRTVTRLESLGMSVLRTDTQGAVAVTVSEGRLGAVAQRVRPPALG